MDFKKYQEEAGVTLLEDDMPYRFAETGPNAEARYISARGPLSLLTRLLPDFTLLASKVDLIKRTLFYGDKFRLALSAQDRMNGLPIVNTSKSRQHGDLVHGIIGVITETGELAEVLEHFLHSNAELQSFEDMLDGINLKEEVGDVMWYLAVICKAGGFTLEEAAEANIRKLRAAYPDKFTEAAARNRDNTREEEREQLEK